MTKPHNIRQLVREMHLSQVFDGKHYWNSASAVERLYEPESMWARFRAWLTR